MRSTQRSGLTLVPCASNGACKSGELVNARCGRKAANGETLATDNTVPSLREQEGVTTRRKPYTAGATPALEVPDTPLG